LSKLRGYSKDTNLLVHIMTQSTDQDLKELKNAVEENSKAIANLTSSISGLHEELRVGFAKLEGQLNNLETKIDGKIDVVKGEIRVVDVKLDERTRIGFWGTLVRVIPLLVLAGLAIAFWFS
jgi:peptidoglycan hydrolase CwlO-like protein